jgi:hypothetical protein
MSEMLARLGFNAQAAQSRPLVAEDFVFAPADYRSGERLAVIHEELYLDEDPLAFTRQVHLQHSVHRHSSITLRLALCWNGFRDCLTLLSRLPLSFQRSIPAAAAVNTAETYGIGDFGLAWSWSGEGEPDVLAFVRNNLYLSIEGHEVAAIVRLLAADLDVAFRALRTTTAYTEDSAGLLAEVRRRAGEVPRLPIGGRLDFGVLAAGPDTTLFFLTTSGSVNRAPEHRDAWYYRAGAVTGRQVVSLFRVGPGILPVKERLTVEIG